MKLTKTGKREAAKKVGEELKAVNNFFFTEYQGLKFTELEKLRKKAKKVADTWRTHFIDLTEYGFYYTESLEEEDFE